MKKAIITGITGQDGAYLAEFLLKKNYIVFGTYRRTSTDNFWRIQDLNIANNSNLNLIDHELTDLSSCIKVIQDNEPDEVYNLAAQSFVSVSFTQPTLTTNINALGTLNILEAIRIVNPKIKFYQASTSEMFGKVQSNPQNENTAFYPRSPYGVAKLYAHWITINYRESYDIFASSGILFNHESPLRSLQFVTRKITNAVANIKLGKQKLLELGNIDSIRDWGYAKDYVDGMWRMLNHDKPDTFVLSTNVGLNVRDFITMAFNYVDINIEYLGSGINEFAINKNNGEIILKINPKFYRPSEVDLLIGDSTKAKQLLNWEPKTSVKELCYLMVKRDLERNS